MTPQAHTRPPAVAGTFYQGDPERLAGEIAAMLAESRPGMVAMGPSTSRLADWPEWSANPLVRTLRHPARREKGNGHLSV